MTRLLVPALAAAAALLPTQLEAITTEFDNLLPEVQAVQAVLDARTAAVRDGDRAAWMATVDPEAPREFKDAQGRHFDGLRSVPMVDFRLQAHVETSGDLAPPGLADRYGAPVFVPETRQLYRYKGYDDRDAVDVLWLTFVDRDGKWYVGGDTDLEGVGLETQRGLWDFGAVEVRRTERLLILSHPQSAARADDLAGIGDEAVEILGRRWSREWAGRIPVILPGSVDELEILLQATIDLDKFVAFVAYGWLEEENGLRATAPRMYIQDRNLSRYGREFQVETLVHELAHAAAVPLVSPLVPSWVHEGVADWVAVGQPTREGLPSGSDGRLPRDYEFTTGSQTEIVRSYRESRSAISFLARRHGMGAPASLLSAVGAHLIAPGNSDFHVDRGLRDIGADGLATFERAWGGT